MLTCTILENGDLRLTAGNTARADLAAMRDSGRNYWSIMAEALEPYSTNGGFEHFDAGAGNPFVGLTSAPCIAESLVCCNDGVLLPAGRVWWLSDYAVRDDLAELIGHGRATYSFGFDAGDPEIA